MTPGTRFLQISLVGCIAMAGCSQPVRSPQSTFIPSTATAVRASGRWSPRAPLPAPRHELAAAVVDATLYAVGGDDAGYRNDLFAYDPAHDAWSARASMPTARCCLAASAARGILYAIGGDRGDNTPLGTLEAYDPATNQWSGLAPMPTPRMYLGAGSIGGVVYAVGGRNATPGDTIALNTFEAYNSATGTWAQLPPMPTARFALGVGVVNNVLYAIGGWNTRLGRPLRTLEAYDPATNAWKRLRPMPTERANFAVGVSGSIIYVMGGNDARRDALDTADAYNVSTNAWTRIKRMPAARQSLAGGVIGSELYAVGGAGDSGILSTVEAFAL